MVKLEKPRQPLGGEGDVWVSLRAAFQRLASSFRVSAAAGAGAHRAKSEARGRRGGAAGRMVPGRGALGCLQRAQGQPCSLRSRPLAPRPPLPAPVRGVRGGRSAHSAPVRSRRSGKPGAQAELSLPSRAERRSCPNSRSRSAPRLWRCCSGARCWGWSGVAARAARTWAPAPAPDPGGARRGGAGQGGAEAPERIPEAPPPGSPFLSAAEDADSDLPEEGET